MVIVLVDVWYISNNIRYFIRAVALCSVLFYIYLDCMVQSRPKWRKICPFLIGFGWLCGETEFKHLSKIAGTVIPHRWRGRSNNCSRDHLLCVSSRDVLISGKLERPPWATVYKKGGKMNTLSENNLIVCAEKLKLLSQININLVS
jgi:hypothetical protein